MKLSRLHQAQALQVSQRPFFETHETFQRYPQGKLRGIMIHGTDVVARDSNQYADNRPANIQKFYKSLNPPCRMPFAIHVDSDGDVTQCVELDKQTPHARMANGSHIGLVCAGDSRGKDGRGMSASQLGALVGVCAHLVKCGLIDTSNADWLESHDDQPAGSSIEFESPTRRLQISKLKEWVKDQATKPVVGLDFFISKRPKLMTTDLERIVDAEAQLWRGDWDQADFQFMKLLENVDAPQARSRICLNSGIIWQFHASQQLQRGSARMAPASFQEAHCLLDLAQDEARSMEPGPLQDLQLDAIELQKLQAHRAAASNTVDATLLARFVELQARLERNGHMPAVVAFIDYLKGDYEAAQRGYSQFLQDAKADEQGLNNHALALCRLGQVELALGRHHEASQHLQEGLVALGHFPEKTQFKQALAQARQASQAA